MTNIIDMEPHDEWGVKQYTEMYNMVFENGFNPLDHWNNLPDFEKDFFTTYFILMNTDEEVIKHVTEQSNLGINILKIMRHSMSSNIKTFIF